MKKKDGDIYFLVWPYFRGSLIQQQQTRGSVGWACVTHLSFFFEEA